MKKIFIIALFALSVVLPANAGRTGPWPKEKAWEWYNKQPWIRGCNYMSADCANRVDQWQGPYPTEADFLSDIARKMPST